MKNMRLALFLAVPCLLGAQLIPSGSPIPKGPHPPVVFMNGYQPSCGNSSFSSTFGNADQILQAGQVSSVFFDNCTVTSSSSGRPAIEALGVAFGAFLGGLRHTDGTAVTEVDVVAHSMGGLILRSYLAGKADTTPARYAPPANPGVRKAVFLATPHFGTSLAGLLGTDVQTQEMSLGSQFLFDLNTWNQGLDDLRGVDALAIAGTGGTGLESGTVSFGGALDDGVVTLTSASLGFLRPGRTRLVPACHASISLLVSFGFCSSNAQPIAAIMDASNITGQMVLSFLTGTTNWQSLGQPIEENGLASALGGLNLQLQDSTGTPLTSIGGTVTSPTGLDAPLGQSANKQVLYIEIFPANSPRPIQIQTAGSPVNATQTLPSGTVSTVISSPVR
jgi:pimeloyl-ACP methyl ester carboxylesterase